METSKVGGRMPVDGQGTKPVPKLDDLSTPGKVHKFSINKAKILSNSAVKNYTGADSVLREFITNSMQAVVDAVKNGLISERNGLVSVTYENDDIIIEDNGIGMSLEKIKSDLSAMGGCQNKDGTRHGYWGTGIFSYLKIGKILVIDTKTADGTGVTVECDGGITFRKTGEGTRTSMGTTMTIKDVKLVENEDISELARIIDMIARIGIAPRVTLKASVGTLDKTFKSGAVERAVKKWKKAGFNSVTYSDDLIDVTWRSSWQRYTSTRTKHVMLLGIPIDTGIFFPFEMFANIKNEREFPPTTSRDSLSRRAIDELKSMLDKILQSNLAKVAHVRNYRDYLDVEDKSLALWFLKYSCSLTNSGRFEQVPENIRRAISSQVYTDSKAPISLREALEKYGTTPISFSPKLGSASISDDAVVICPTKADGRVITYASEYAAEFGIPVVDVDGGSP